MVNTIISKSLKSSMSYADYRQLVETLVREGSTTGHDKTEDLSNYTMLNDRRMKRWDKTIKVSEEMAVKIKQFNKKSTWLVLTESWCGDAAHILPVINKVAELNAHIDFKVVLRDDNDALMHQFLTNGGKSIPKLIMIDHATNTVVDTFGPRPEAATLLVNDYKKLHGTVAPEFKEILQHWYNKDKGQSTIEDLVKLIS